MLKGIRFHDLRKETVCEKIKLFKDCGFEYAQLVLEKAEKNYTLKPFTAENAQAIKRQFEGVKIAVLGSYINPSTYSLELLDQELEKFKEKIRYASIIQPMVLATETCWCKGSPSEADDTEEAYQHLLGSMKELLKIAEEYGVTIAIEGVVSHIIKTPKKMRRLIDDLHSDYVKVIFDPVNYLNRNNYERQNEMIIEFFALLADKIVALHAKDFIYDKGLRRVCLGEGELNYDLIFRQLKQYRLEIPIITEGYDECSAIKGLIKLEKIEENIYANN